MTRGRPVFSVVRQNMIEVLYFLGKATGYDIYKIYCGVYPKVTLRLMYYHLKKGVEIGEFKIKEVKKEKGNYSWGPEAEKTYYTVGDKAKPKADERVKKYIDSLKKK